MSELLPGRSYLVVGGVHPDDVGAVLPIDRVEVDGSGLAIKELRLKLASAYQRPFGSQRLLVVHQAEELTEACQNTLLKALEEPPSTLTIILEVRSAEGLLPTVRSRLTVASGTAVGPEEESVLTGNESTMAQTLQAVKDRSSLASLLKQELRFQLQHLADQSSATRLGTLEQAITTLEHNGNQKLVIDRLLLHWFGETSK